VDAATFPARKWLLFLVLVFFQILVDSSAHSMKGLTAQNEESNALEYGMIQRRGGEFVGDL